MSSAFASTALTHCTSTAASAWLGGDLINKAYLNQDTFAVVHIGLLAALVFAMRGAANYGHGVMLWHLSNGIIAENQRHLFAKLLQQSGE